MKGCKWAGASLAFGLICIIMAWPAAAGFKICNKTDREVTTAFGYLENGEWTSQGWWTISPGDCKTVYSKNLTNQYYYAESTDGEWFWSNDSQDSIFCATDKAFKIVGDKDCKKRGYDAYGFREVDVGERIDDYIDLTME